MFSCARRPSNQPKTHRPRVWFPPHLPPLVRLSFSPVIPATSINAVPTKPPMMDHDKSSNGFMQLPLGRAFAVWLVVRPRLVPPVDPRRTTPRKPSERCRSSRRCWCRPVNNQGCHRPKGCFEGLRPLEAGQPVEGFGDHKTSGASAPDRSVDRAYHTRTGRSPKQENRCSPGH